MYIGQVQGLLESYSEMPVELPEATTLKDLRDHAQTWAAEAQQQLDTAQPISESQAPVFEVRVSSLLVPGLCPRII